MTEVDDYVNIIPYYSPHENTLQCFVTRKYEGVKRIVHTQLNSIGHDYNRLMFDVLPSDCCPILTIYLKYYLENGYFTTVDLMVLKFYLLIKFKYIWPLISGLKYTNDAHYYSRNSLIFCKVLSNVRLVLKNELFKAELAHPGAMNRRFLTDCIAFAANLSYKDKRFIIQLQRLWGFIPSGSLFIGLDYPD
jgi:hypothetical protein